MYTDSYEEPYNSDKESNNSGTESNNLDLNSLNKAFEKTRLEKE